MRDRSGDVGGDLVEPGDDRIDLRIGSGRFRNRDSDRSAARRDLLRRPAGVARERLHFARHDREALAGLAGTRGARRGDCVCPSRTAESLSSACAGNRPA